LGIPAEMRSQKRITKRVRLASRLMLRLHGFERG
jgi:hypothetical protein